jgi:hypothetical protein
MDMETPTEEEPQLKVRKPRVITVNTSNEQVRRFFDVDLCIVVHIILICLISGVGD